MSIGIIRRMLNSDLHFTFVLFIIHAAIPARTSDKTVAVTAAFKEFKTAVPVFGFVKIAFISAAARFEQYLY